MSKRGKFHFIRLFQQTFGKIGDPKTWLLIIAFVLALAWLPDGLVAILQLVLADELIGVGMFVFAAGFFFFAYREFRRKFPPYRFVVRRKNPECVEPQALIVNLSMPRSPQGALSESVVSELVEGSLKKSSHSWAMPLLAVEQFQHSLRLVYVIGSTDGSYAYINEFRSILQRRFPHLDVIVHEQSVDFEDLEESIAAIEHGYRRLRAEQGISSPDRIVIDITGGQKVQSAAGAFVSLTRDRHFVYVSTNKREVQVFDVEVDSEE